jgi:hypothetical protein
MHRKEVFEAIERNGGVHVVPASLAREEIPPTPDQPIKREPGGQGEAA